ncbi:MAG: hypothetical protein JXA10_03530 [Anaerolineae bacterium]|nr:hypothetical protein [Anaerolineae bacterium]
MIAADDISDSFILYIAIENTGWSAGVIGFRAETLDPEALYVALEMDMAGAPIEGGWRSIWCMMQTRKYSYYPC